MRGMSAPLIKLSLFTGVTVLLTIALVMTIAATSTGPTSSYAAKFTDASGIDEGDEVRMAGVKVGKVTSLEVVDGTRALIRFAVDSTRSLPEATVASVKYRNLAGQRYLDLDAAMSDEQQALPAGATIPLAQTNPALNLTELFNGFQPLFQALSPKDVNKLSSELIQVLQGQGSTIDSVLAHTASLTSTMAKKDEVIGQVIDNLNVVLGEVNARGPQLSELVTSVQRLVSGLAEQRKPIGEAVTAMDELANTTGGLIRDVRKPLRQDVAALNKLSKNLNAELPRMEHDLRTLPHRLDSLTRTVSYGSWFNFYLCQMSGTVGISDLGIKVPITPVAKTEMPKRCQS